LAYNPEWECLFPANLGEVILRANKHGCNVRRNVAKYEANVHLLERDVDGKTLHVVLSPAMLEDAYSAVDYICERLKIPKEIFFEKPSPPGPAAPPSP